MPPNHLPTHPPTNVFSLTEQGAATAKRVLAHLPQARHYHQAKPFIATVQAAFNKGERGVFICATGIVIRALAPVLKDKYQDPAVLVLDEHGEYVIPLLSGHVGGAGELAHNLAAGIGAQCVVTSATDYGRAVYTIGMGSDRACPLPLAAALLTQIKAQLPNGVAIDAIASIDLKADEPSLLTLAAQLGLRLKTYSAAQLRAFDGQLSQRSAVVFKEVGCYGVAEAAALCAAEELTAQPAELLILKQKNARATIAVARSYRALMPHLMKPFSL